jgi:hypothetical protein
MTTIPALLLQNEAGSAGVVAFLSTMLVVLAVVVVIMAGFWRVFVKAGQPGWAILIPIYNLYIMMKIAGRPGWWLLLFMIPLVNIVIMLLVAIDIAKAFGRSAAFGVVMLFLLGGIGYLILGFGKSRYLGPAAASATAS